MKRKSAVVSLSIVSTVYNDADIVPHLVDQIQKHTNPLNILYEVILVNDCSIDNSENEIKKICEKFENVKCVSLARNYGQQIAMSAGIRFSSGKYVLIMDGDLQNPPSAIPRLYNEITKGHDIVYTVSSTRNNIIDRITSAIFWFLLTKIFGVKIIKNQLMLKIMTREFVDYYNNYSETNRTVTGIVHDISSNYKVIDVQNIARNYGKSHYTFLSRFNLLIDIVISLSNAPLNMMIYFGFFNFIVTIIFSFVYLFNYFWFNVTPGFTSIILSIFFFGSLIIILLGFVGRYLSNIYTEVRNRPLFHVKSLVNVENKLIVDV